MELRIDTIGYPRSKRDYNLFAHTKLIFMTIVQLF